MTPPYENSKINCNLYFLDGLIRLAENLPGGIFGNIAKNYALIFAVVPIDIWFCRCYLKHKILTLSHKLRERCEYGSLRRGRFRGLLLPYPLGYGNFYFGRQLWKREWRL